MIEAYPLSWPDGYERSAVTRPSKFKSTLPDAIDFLKGEVKRLNGKDLVISSNIPVKSNGDPYADWTRYKIDDHGVAVYFLRNGKQVCLCCDTYKKVWENLHAIARTISSLRQIDRDGVSDFLNRTFAGFPALPEVTEAETDIWPILGLTSKPADVEILTSSYRAQLRIVHPDRPTGTREAFDELQEAYRKAIKLYNPP
jgi:hypothetical protein